MDPLNEAEMFIQSLIKMIAATRGVVAVDPGVPDGIMKLWFDDGSYVDFTAPLARPLGWEVSDAT